MARDIKFRAWDYFNEVMIYDSDDETDFKFYNGKTLIKYVTEQHTVENGIDIDRPIWNQADGPVMQYTGLKDKNSKEIYEGDLNKDMGVVIWNESDASFCWDYKEVEVMPMGEENDWCEIIGNIYENPELLNKER